MYLPYIMDSDLKPEGFEQFYEDGEVTLRDGSVRTVHVVVDENRAKFELDCLEFEKAQEIANEQGVEEEDAWGGPCPEQEVERL